MRALTPLRLLATPRALFFIFHASPLGRPSDQWIEASILFLVTLLLSLLHTLHPASLLLSTPFYHPNCILLALLPHRSFPSHQPIPSSLSLSLSLLLLQFRKRIEDLVSPSDPSFSVSLFLAFSLFLPFAGHGLHKYVETLHMQFPVLVCVCVWGGCMCVERDAHTQAIFDLPYASTDKSLRLPTKKREAEKAHAYLDFAKPISNPRSRTWTFKLYFPLVDFFLLLLLIWQRGNGANAIFDGKNLKCLDYCLEMHPKLKKFAIKWNRF